MSTTILLEWVHLENISALTIINDTYWAVGSVAFRSESTKYYPKTLKRPTTSVAFYEKEGIPSACFYTCRDKDYDNAMYHSWGWEAEGILNASNGIYIDNLCDKVEYLFNIEPDIRKPLCNAKDRLYRRAIIQYFKTLNDDIIWELGESSKLRFSMTYPSAWTPEKVDYLRFLVQAAGVVDENDHPDRLLMYSEGESVIHLLQVLEEEFNTNIKQGYNYLICDASDAQLKMDLYDIESVVGAENNMKVGRHCDWDINYMKEPCQLPISIQDLIKQCERYLLLKLFEPSMALAIQDVELQIEPVLGQRKEFKVFVDGVAKHGIENLSKRTITRNEPITFKLPPSLQPYVLRSTSSAYNFSGSKSIFSETEHLMYPAELDENVFKPIFGKVVQYFDNILHGLGSSVKAIILVGELFSSVYVTEMIEEICKRAGTECINPFQPNDNYREKFDAPLSGSINKSIDTTRVYDCIPKMALDERNHSTKPTTDNLYEAFIFIDYSSIDTRISYILDQPNEVFDTSNIKSITDWPGQVCSDKVCPTVNVMLIPRCVLRIGKRIVSLKENDDHDDQFLKYTLGNEREYEYHTFKKCKRDIIQYIHRREIVNSESTQIHNDVEELQIAQSISNSCMNEKDVVSTALLESTSSTYSLPNDDTSLPYSSTITQKRISFKEFSMMYFEYLTSFLYSYFYAKLGAKNVRFRFCITRDSHSESAGFKLSDDDIYSIATKCGMKSTENYHCDKKLLVLEQAEATAIYCRELISSSYINSRKGDIGFIQLQLTTDRCLLLLNRIPFFDENKDDTQSGQSWKGIYKYAISRSIAFNCMNVICQNLWIYVQNQQRASLKRCGRHLISKRFFSLNNMHVFSELLHLFLSTVSLDLMDGDRVHEICICKGDEEKCCRLFIANIDLVQFGVIPTITSLVSIIQSSILDHHFHQGLLISNIFLMGGLLYCQSQQDYKFLEDLLLINLRNINFASPNKLALNHKIEKPQVTKVEGRYRNANNEVSDEMEQNSLLDIILKGSVMYGIHPQNRLVERLASKTYLIRFDIINSQGQRLNYINDRVDVDGSDDDDVDDFIGDFTGDFTGDFISNMESVDSKDNTSIDASDENIEFIDSEDESVYLSRVVYVTCSKLEPYIIVNSNMLIPIVKKGMLLSSLMAPGEEGEIETSFKIYNCLENVIVYVFLYCPEEDDVDKLIFRRQKRGDLITAFYAPVTRPSYPIIFKSQLSQSGSYKFWVESDIYTNNLVCIQEKVLLKDSYRKQFAI